jgi:hypothetical protein
MSFALYKSCPAAYALPFVGARALSLSSRTCSCCSALAAAAIDGAIGAGGCRPRASDMLVCGMWVLARGVGVEMPESVSRGSVEVLLRGVGSITRVRFGSGELGRDGGSWAGRGVDAGSIICDMWNRIWKWRWEAVKMFGGVRRVAWEQIWRGRNDAFGSQGWYWLTGELRMASLFLGDPRYDIFRKAFTTSYYPIASESLSCLPTVARKPQSRPHLPPAYHTLAAS